MKETDELGLRFLILLGIFFLFRSAYGQSVPIVLKYGFSQPEIVRNVFIYDKVTYDSIVMASLDRYGAPGFPVMPFKTIKVLIPQDSDVQNIEIITGDKVSLAGKYRIEYGRRQAPLSSEVIIENKPNKEIYVSTTAFHDRLYLQLPVQNFRGYKILILNLYPVQYVPSEGLVQYFVDMTVKINLTATSEISPLFRNLPKDKAEVTKKVDNPDAADTYTKTMKRSHKGCICDPADSYDYVIITSNALKNSSGDPNFHDLVSWKQQKGIGATIVTVEEIMADADYACDGAYGDGCGSGDDFNDTQSHIRNFIKDAHENWETEYVLLGGDGDGADVGGESGDNIIPHRGFYVSIPGQATDSDIPADLYYAALDGSWNDDQDDRWGEDGEEDFYAEVYIGRTPIDSDEELSNFVNKTITYESISLPKSYLGKGLMLGEWAGGYHKYTGRYKDQIKDDSSADGYTTSGLPDYFSVTTLYDKDEVWDTGDLINEINNETHIINHVAHCGNAQCMRLTNSNVDNDLQNNWPFLVYSQGCYSAAFDNRTVWDYIPVDAIGEHHVTNNSHAAFAYLGNSRYGWGIQDPGTDSASQRLDREFFDAIFGENILEVGKANQDSKEDNIGLILEGYSCVLGYGIPPCYEVMKWVYYDFTLLGDPELKIWRAVPQFIIKNNSGSNVAHFDDFGNLVLKGTLDANTTPTATANDEFRFQDPNGSDLAIIDANSGDMYITGLLYENQSTFDLDGDNHFIIKDGNDTAVAYIDDPNGSLYLKGGLHESSNP